MARLRAVVTIHPPGLGGTPSDGHRATATVNASWTDFLGGVDIAEEADQGGDAATVLAAEDSLDSHSTAMTDHSRCHRGRSLAGPHSRYEVATV